MSSTTATGPPPVDPLMPTTATEQSAVGQVAATEVSAGEAFPQVSSSFDGAAAVPVLQIPPLDTVEPTNVQVAPAPVSIEPAGSSIAELRSEMESKQQQLHMLVAESLRKVAASGSVTAVHPLVPILLDSGGKQTALTKEEAAAYTKRFPAQYTLVGAQQQALNRAKAAVNATGSKSASTSRPLKGAALGRSTSSRGYGEQYTSRGAPPPSAEPTATSKKRRRPPALTTMVGKECRLELKQRLREFDSALERVGAQVATIPNSTNNWGRKGGEAGKEAEAPAETPPNIVALVESNKIKRLTDCVNKQCVSTLKHVMSHRWAFPFNQPVEPEKLGLVDYYEIVKNPMDLGTVMSNIQTGQYGSEPLDVCTDIRRVFSNAQLYNPPGTDVNVMATSVSEVFENRWASVVEARVTEIHAMAHTEKAKAVKRGEELERARAAEVTTRHARELQRTLEDTERQLEDLKRQLTGACRPLSWERKARLEEMLHQLSSDQCITALSIISNREPTYYQTQMSLEVDLEAIDPFTLRKLEHHVRAVLRPPKPAPAEGQENGEPAGDPQDDVEMAPPPTDGAAEPAAVEEDAAGEEAPGAAALAPAGDAEPVAQAGPAEAAEGEACEDVPMRTDGLTAEQPVADNAIGEDHNECVVGDAVAMDAAVEKEEVVEGGSDRPGAVPPDASGPGQAPASELAEEPAPATGPQEAGASRPDMATGEAGSDGGADAMDCTDSVVGEGGGPLADAEAPVPSESTEHNAETPAAPDTSASMPEHADAKDAENRTDVGDEGPREGDSLGTTGEADT